MVQCVAITVQTAIAAFMLWTLVQSAKILSVTTRQLEATIDPVVSTSMFGSTLVLANDGAVDVERVTRTAVVAGWFDTASRKIVEYQVVRTQQLLTNALPRGTALHIDLRGHLVPLPSGVLRDPSSGMKVYSLVVAYRRAADMKPFVRLLPFSVTRDTPTQTSDIFMPLFPSFGSAETGPGHTDYTRITEEARTELIVLYKDKVAQLNVE